jgi:hypothetical protein
MVMWKMAPHCQRFASSAPAARRHRTKVTPRTSALERLTAFDDDELCGWLVECVEDGSERFLCAVAEAALAAASEDYVVIRPALVVLKRRHSRANEI